MCTEAGLCEITELLMGLCAASRVTLHERMIVIKVFKGKKEKKTYRAPAPGKTK